MSKLTQSTIARIIACFLFTVSASAFVLSAIAIVVLSECNVYFDDGAALRYYLYSNYAYEAEAEIMNEYVIPKLQNGETADYNYLNERFSGKNSNVAIVAETADGTVLYSNSAPAGSRYNNSNSWQIEIPSDTAFNDSSHDIKITVPNDGSGSFFYQNRSRDIFSTSTMLNAYTPQTELYTVYNKDGGSGKFVTVNVTTSISDILSVRDKLFYLVALADLFIKNRYPLVLICIVTFLAALFFFVFMLYSSGHRKGHEGIYLEPQDKIPLDLFSFAALFLIYVTVYFAYIVIRHYALSNVIISTAALLAAFILVLLILLSLVLTFVTRIKYGKWWKNTLFFKIIHLVYKILEFIFRKIARLVLNLPLFWKTALIFAIITALELIVLFRFSFGTIFVWWLVEKLIVGSVLFFTITDMKNIKRGAEEIASGNTEYKIETRNMYGDFKSHAETLNKVNDGLSNAVNERMKSERLKTELITNVSHDLKTPLTSIVNYVDLMKKEDIQPEKAKEYLEVLDRQSKKLRKLTLDLLEASKASTGNIKVETEPTDINVFLSQLEGEYAERLAANDLELHIKNAEEGTYINADGRLLSRVFDNLMTNICKYTQPGTRVYVTAKSDSGSAVIEFKNISKHQLNISGDELMERFVRGDSSRNTEGSGLGLSIAKSLTELQNGSLEIMVDGDLFKAVVTMTLTSPLISFSEEDV